CLLKWDYLFLLMVLGIQLVACRVFIARIDEGMLLSSAIKVVAGQVLYRAFFEFWMPGAIYVTGWMLQWFGALETVRWGLLAGLQFGVVVCVFYILKKLGIGLMARVVFCLGVVGLGLSLLYLSHHWFAIL